LNVIISLPSFVVSFFVVYALFYLSSIFEIQLTGLAEALEHKKSSSTGYTSKSRIRDKYIIVGFISSGTYGRVYKATGKDGQQGHFAIKKCVR
jgi:cyclin-dependent kinase 8/11